MTLQQSKNSTLELVLVRAIQIVGDPLTLADDAETITFPDANQLITEDDTPVDNCASEKQQRLLTACLYSNRQGKPFIAAANVGIYHTVSQPAIVLDVFVSFGVQVPDD